MSSQPADIPEVMWSMQRDRRWRGHGGEEEGGKWGRHAWKGSEEMRLKWTGEKHGGFYCRLIPLPHFLWLSSLCTISSSTSFISHFNTQFSFKDGKQNCDCCDAWRLTGEDISISMALHLSHHWVTGPLQQSKEATWMRVCSERCVFSHCSIHSSRICWQKMRFALPAATTRIHPCFFPPPLLLAAWWGRALQLNSFLICMCDICD